MKKIIIVSVVSLALAACAGQSKMTNTAIGTGVGAATGAAVGAGIGAIAGDAGKGAWIGAAAGAALGTGVGYYLGSQEEELQKGLQGTDVKVERQGEDLNVVMPGNVAFATGSANITPSFYSTLDAVANVLVKYPESTITISGHTDSVGNAAANQELSQRRAESVKQYLMNKGVAAQRMQAVGFGDRNPIASNDNEAGRSKNRRVEIKIHSTKQQ
jgi:outer membrane protein OmpA-like peptidoglycan-associated protein